MSISVIKKQIDTFLDSESPEVMAIKGDWGIGKTYTWNKYLQEAKSENRIKLQKYSYVSLFGVNSLDSFKYSIFENILDRKLIGTEASVDTFKQNTSNLLASLGRKSVKLVKGASVLKDFAPAIESLSFLSVEKALICIDDLERKGQNLSIKDVLGLVSLLKEQKKCKVVILLNDGEDGLDDYIKYREKAIDTELRFNPTPEECAGIAFNEDIDFVHKNLSRLSQRLKIRNIRVLKKIERLVELAKPLCQNLEEEILYQVIHSITLFSWSFFCRSDDVPPLDFVLNRGYRYMGIGDEEESDEHKKWNGTLSDYDYGHTDEFDLVLAEAVQTGYFDEMRFDKSASEKNSEIIASKSEGSFSKAWEMYHNSFDDDQDAVINSLYESFKNNALYISPTNLNGTVSLLKDLGEVDKALEIIDLYVELRKDNIESLNLKEINFFGDIQDDDVVKKFNETYEASVTKESAKEVLTRIAGKDSYNQSDEVILANTSVDDYYELFKSENGKHLSSFVRTCLRFGEFSNASDNGKQVSSRVKEALIRVAGESDINMRRVKKFGIEP